VSKEIHEKMLTNTELSAFCGQMALILRSGISPFEGIQTMLEDSTDEAETRILQKIADDLSENGTFAHALESTGLFPEYLVKMTGIGEETGTLDETMDGLATHYEREEAIARSIRGAVTFPAVMTIMMLIVIFVLLTRVMPIFNQVYQQLGTEMTGVSGLLLSVGNAVNRYGLFLIIPAAILAIQVLIFTRTQKGRAAYEKLEHKLHLNRKLNAKIGACRFAAGMAFALRSGLDISRSLELSTDLIDDPALRSRLKNVKSKTEDGMELSTALHEEGIFAGIYARMINIGQKTGSMDSAMEKVSKLYEDEIDSSINNKLAALEPALVIILSVIVGAILLSVMLPLMGIMSTL